VVGCTSGSRGEVPGVRTPAIRGDDDDDDALNKLCFWTEIIYDDACLKYTSGWKFAKIHDVNIMAVLTQFAGSLF